MDVLEERSMFRRWKRTALMLEGFRRWRAMTVAPEGCTCATGPRFIDGRWENEVGWLPQQFTVNGKHIYPEGEAIHGTAAVV